MTERDELERRVTGGDVEAMVQLATTLHTEPLVTFLTAVGECDLVLGEEELELLRLIRGGDEDAFQRLVESQLRLVVSITKYYRNKGLPFLDLIAVGVIGCVCAIWACRETPEVRFRGAVLQYIRDAVLLALEALEGKSTNVIPDDVARLCAPITDCVMARGASGDGPLDPVRIQAILIKLSETSPAVRLLSENAMRQTQASRKADEWLSRAAELGSSAALDLLAGHARTAGDLAAAREMSERGADAGNAGCMIRLAQLAAEEGNSTSEREWYERAAEAGSIKAMLMLARAAQNIGDNIGFREWSERAAEAGSPIGLNDLGHILVEAGDLEAARPLLAKSAGGGYDVAFATIGQLERAAGNSESAHSWWMIGVERDETNSMMLLAEALEERGEFAIAQQWYEVAALLGDDQAMFELSVRCERAGEDANARYWRLRAAARGWEAPE
jgi:TPR repeat protein